jgi:hypothetical protein
VQLEALQQNMTKYVSTAERAIQLLPMIVLSGGKRVVPNQQDSVLISFTPPVEDENGELQFTDISLQVQQYGNYQIMVLIDGIESPISGSITVEAVPFSLGAYVPHHDNVALYRVLVDQVIPDHFAAWRCHCCFDLEQSISQ